MVIVLGGEDTNIPCEASGCTEKAAVFRTDDRKLLCGKCAKRIESGDSRVSISKPAVRREYKGIVRP